MTPEHAAAPRIFVASSARSSGLGGAGTATLTGDTGWLLVAFPAVGSITNMEVRTRILEAALGLLAESGAHELTQPRVARAAGVRQSHLTYYFPTRATLMQAIARHSIERLARELAGAREGNPSQMARAIAAASSDRRIARVMLGLVTAADRDPAIRRQFRRFVAELRGLMAPTLAAGGLRTEPACLAFFHSVVIGCAVLQLARDSAEARAEARTVLEMAARAIARVRR